MPPSVVPLEPWHKVQWEERKVQEQRGARVLSHIIEDTMHQ